MITALALDEGIVAAKVVEWCGMVPGVKENT
jgi:hypothetical protein